MTAKLSVCLTLLTVPVLLAFWLAGCGGASAPAAELQATAPPTPDLRAQAAAEATAIVQQAQATALVLQAQAQATALLQQALAQGDEMAPAATPTTRALPAVLPTPWAPEEEPTASPAQDPGATAGAGLTTTVELLGVGFAAEGAFINVSFRAPPLIVHSFWPGVLSVTDESSGMVFEEVPVMPVIGPLIGRPVEEGQVGYVMFVHAPAILRPGSLVTVDLAGYTFEHVPVQ